MNEERSAPSQPVAPQPGPYPYPAFYPAYPPEEEVSLLNILRVLGRRWWLILLFTLLGTGGAVYYALTAAPVFRARAVIAPPEQKRAPGASAALAAFGGLGADLAGSLGFSVGGADANRLEALLKSHRLTERVITKHNLLPALFPERWDASQKTWKAEGREEVPNVWDAERELGRIFRVRNDLKMGVLTLTLEMEDPKTAQGIVANFLDELGLLMQQDEQAKIRANEEFARQQLRQASDPLVLSKLQTILSDQIDKAMMARNLEDFAFEVIDPPAGSDRKVRPKRALVVALGFAGSLLGGVVVALFVDWLRSARAQTQA